MPDKLPSYNQTVPVGTKRNIEPSSQKALPSYGETTPVGTTRGIDTNTPYEGVSSPELNTRSEAEDFINRFMLKKDEIDLAMYQGFKAKYGEQGSDSIWNKFLDNRINTNAQDVVEGHDKIKYTDEDNTPFKGLSDLLNRPNHFFSNQLPELLGSSLGQMVEPIVVGAATGAALGSVIPGAGNAAGGAGGLVTGAISGLTGMLTGRFMESMSEGGSAYQEAMEILKRNHPEMSYSQRHEKAKDVMNQVFNQNMKLGLMDAPELMLAFSDIVGSKLGKAFPKFGKTLSKLDDIGPKSTWGKTALNTAKFGVGAGLEGAEEGIQHYITQDALNQVRLKKDRKDTSLAGMWEDEEFQSSVQSGILLGGMLNGAGTIANKVHEMTKKLDDMSPEQAKAELNNFKEEKIYNDIKNGRSQQTKDDIMNQKDALYADAGIRDKEVRDRKADEQANKAVKEIEHREELYHSINANAKIADEDSKKVAYKNTLAIEENEKEIKKLEKAYDLNKDEIEDRLMENAKLGAINKLIGQGKSVITDGAEFKKLKVEKPQEILQEEKKEAEQNATTNKEGKKVVEEVPTHTTVEQKVVPISKGSLKINTKTEESTRVQEEEKPEVKADTSLPYKTGDQVTVNNPRINDKLDDIQYLETNPNGSIKVSALNKDDERRIETTIPRDNIVVPQQKEVSEEQRKANNIAFADEHQLTDEIKKWSEKGLKSGEVINKIKDKVLKHRGMTHEDIRTLVHDVREKLNIPSQKDKEAYEAYQKKVNPEVKEPKITAKNAPLTEEQRKEQEDDVIKKLQSLKINTKGQANDVTTLLSAAIWNKGVDTAIVGYKSYKNITRALREAMEHVRNTGWYKGLTKKQKRQVNKEMNEMATKQFKEFGNTAQAKEQDGGDDNGITGLDQENNINNEDFQVEAESGVYYDDNDSRINRHQNQVRKFYQDIEGVLNRDSDALLYALVKMESFNEANLRGELDNIRSASPKLAERLEELTDADLVQLFNNFKNKHLVPFFHQINMGGKFTSELSNPSHEKIANVTNEIKSKLENKEAVKEAVRKYKENLAAIYKKFEAQGIKYYDINKHPAMKSEVLDNEMQLLKELTGYDWNDYINNKSFQGQEAKKAGFKDYKDFYVNTPAYKDKKGNVQKLGDSFIKRFIISADPSKVGFFLLAHPKEINEKSTQTKSNIEQFAQYVGKTFPEKLGVYFDNVENNRKSGYVLRSHLIDFANKVHLSDSKFLKDNSYVNYFKGLGESPGVAIYDGLKNNGTNESKEVGSLAPEDFTMSLIISFINPGVLAKAGEYLQPIEQLSDKKQTVFTRAFKYNVAQAKKKLEIIRKGEFGKYLPTEEEIKKEIQTIEAFITKNNKDLGVENIKETAEQFVHNFIVNKHFTDLYYQGKPQNYEKKGKFDYVSMVKRAGSMHSSGEVLNTKIQNGIGETSKHIVITNNEQLLEIKDGEGNTLYSFPDSDIADGQTFHTKAWDDKVRVSSGGLYGGILKPIYSYVNEKLERILIKSNSILLSEDYVKDKPHLKNLLDLMNAHGADYLTVQSGVKHDEANSVTKFDWKTGQVEGDVKVNDRLNENWRIQQDFTQNEELDAKRLTKQMMRHFMEFENGPKVQGLFNDFIKKEMDKLIKDLKEMNPGEIRSFLLDKIEDSESNYHIRSLLANGVSLDHPHVAPIISAMFASNVTKKMLDVKGNGAIYIEASSVGKELKSMRIENGEVQPGQVLVPQKSGLKKGERIFITRVPSSNHHSTAWVEVAGFIPHEMGNVIVTDPITQKIAGSDFDGDARHIWAPFKDKEGNVIEGKSNKALINQAFNLIQEDYQKPENFKRIMAPIDLDATKKAVENSDFREKIGNKNLPSSVAQMYKNNNDGKTVVGIVATASKIQSYLRAHSAKISELLQLPFIEEGQLQYNEALQYIDLSDESKEQIANNVNQAVDAAKEQNLVSMGMTKVGASLYNMIQMLGVPEKFAINYFAHPLVRAWMDEMENVKRVGASMDEFQVIDAMAEKIKPGCTTKKEGEKVEFPAFPKSAKLTLEDIEGITPENKLRFLENLKALVNISNDLFKIKSVIDLSENAPKSFQEYYTKSADFGSVITNTTRFSLENMSSSPYIETARMTIDIADQFYKQATIFGTYKAQQIIKAFELINSKSGKLKGLSKENIETLSNALNNLMLAEIMNRGDRKEITARVKEEFKNFEGDNKFLDLLEVDKTGKLGVKMTKRREDMEVGEMNAIKEDFEKLPEQFKHDLVQNTYFEHGFGRSKKLGGYSTFLSDNVHKEISDALDVLRFDWNAGKEYNDISRINDAMRAIIEQHPNLIPEVKSNLHEYFNESQFTLKGYDKIDPPQFFKSNGIVYTRLRDSNRCFYSKEAKGNFEIKPSRKNEVKVYNPNQKYQTSRPLEQLASTDPETAEYIAKRFKELYPDVQVEFISNHQHEGMNVLGMAAGNTIHIDPTRAVQSTYFHEKAHLYWDALPANDSLKEELLKEFGSEEEAIQAIGEAGYKLAKQESKHNGFTNLLIKFWKKVKALFGITTQNQAEKMADRIWNRVDNVSFTELSDDIVKYQLASGVQDEQETKIKKLTEIMDGDLSIISPKDVEKYTDYGRMSSATEEDMKEAGVIIPEGKTLEDFTNNPELFYSKLSRNEDAIELLEPIEYAKKKNIGSLFNLNEVELKRFNDMYSKYVENHKRVKEMWKSFPSVNSLNDAKLRELREMFNEMEDMDEHAVGVLKNIALDKIYAYWMASYVREENSKDFNDYKLASLALYEMVEQGGKKGEKVDFTSPLSQWMTSAKDIGDKQKMLQLHYKKMARQQAEAQLDYSSIQAKLSDLALQIKKDKGNIKATVHVTTDENGTKTMEFKKKGTPAYNVLLPSEKAYIDYVVETRKYYGEGKLKSLAIPSVQQDFVSIMRKYGMMKAIQVSIFAPNANDEIFIKDDFGQEIQLKDAKAAVKLDEKNGIIDKIKGVYLLDKYESQAKELRKRGYDVQGNVIFQGHKGRVPMGFGFEHNEYSSDNVDALMKEYLHKLVFKDKMEKYLPMAAFFQKYYSDGSTKFVQEWLTSFNDNILYGKNPNSKLGGMEKYMKFMLQWTAWRYLALNPVGMVFNLSAGFTGSMRELGWSVMMTAMKRMTNFRKAYGIMKHHHVVNTTIDSDLSESTKTWKSFQRAIFSTIEVAETINQAYSYIGQMTPIEWESYDNHGNLIAGKDGISNDRHIYLMESSANVNGAYATMLRRPISYTTEGRLLMQFKGWLPDIFLSHWQKYKVDAHGQEKRGIVNTMIDPKVWDLMVKGLANRKAWESLNQADKENIGKATRELVLIAMGYMLIASMDDDDENKELIAGVRRAIGDVTFVFDLDNWSFAFDSPAPVFSTIKDLITAINELLHFQTYQRTRNGHEAGDLTAPDKFLNLVPAHRVADILE